MFRFHGRNAGDAGAYFKLVKYGALDEVMIGWLDPGETYQDVETDVAGTWNKYYSYDQEVWVKHGGTHVTAETEPDQHPEMQCGEDPPEEPKCKNTGRYIIQLGGNYACNLISMTDEIPARFRNPKYTAPLCVLRDCGGEVRAEHEWDGTIKVRKETTCEPVCIPCVE
jgi:hypothetical protein